MSALSVSTSISLSGRKFGVQCQALAASRWQVLLPNQNAKPAQRSTSLLSFTHATTHCAGAFACLATIIPPAGCAHSHQAATTDLCTELAPHVHKVVQAAVDTRGEELDRSAVAFLAAFAAHCSNEHLGRVIKRNPVAPPATVPITTRLVSLCSTEDDAAIVQAVHSLLHTIAHRLPDCARDIVHGLLSGIGGAESAAAGCRVARALLCVLTNPPQSASKASTGQKVSPCATFDHM